MAFGKGKSPKHAGAIQQEIDVVMNEALRTGRPLTIDGESYAVTDGQRVAALEAELERQRPVIAAAVAYRDAAPPMQQLDADKARVLLDAIGGLVKAVNEAGL